MLWILLLAAQLFTSRPTSIVFSNTNKFSLNIQTTSGSHTFVLLPGDDIDRSLASFQTTSRLTVPETNQLSQIIFDRIEHQRVSAHRASLQYAYELIEIDPTNAEPLKLFIKIANDPLAGVILRGSAFGGASVSLRVHGRLEQGLRMAEKALIILRDQYYAPARNQMGILCYQMKLYEDALQHFSFALKTVTEANRIELILNMLRCVIWTPQYTFMEIKEHFVKMLQWNSDISESLFIEHVLTSTMEKSTTLMFSTCTLYNNKSHLSWENGKNRSIGHAAAVAIATQCHKSTACMVARTLAHKKTWNYIQANRPKHHRASSSFRLVIELWLPKNNIDRNKFNVERFEELLSTLSWNLSQKSISSIYILGADETIQNIVQQRLRSHPAYKRKVRHFRIGSNSRSNFTTLLELGLETIDGADRSNELGLIISNADIAFVGETLRPPSCGTAFALLRREWQPSPIPSWVLNFRADQQDSWIFSIADVAKRIKKFHSLQVPLGKLGTDGRIAQGLRKIGFHVTNPALSIEIRHMHRTQHSRTYTTKDAVALIDRSNFSSASVNLCY